MSNTNELTARMQQYALAYIETGSKKEAYIRAYSTENMSNDTICQKAFEVSRHPLVAGEIERLQREEAKRHQVTADKVIAKLASMALKDLPEIVVVDGKLEIKNFQINEEDNAASGEIFGRCGMVALNAAYKDRMRSLELLGKRFGLFKPVEENDDRVNLIFNITRNPPEDQ